MTRAKQKLVPLKFLEFIGLQNERKGLRLIILIFCVCEKLKNTLIKGNKKLRFQADAQDAKCLFPTAPDGPILCPDFRALTKLSSVHVRTFVRSLKLFVFVGFFFAHVQT